MADRRLTDPEREQAAHMVATFSVLIHAWQTNNFAEAAQAKQQLQEQGVRVLLPRLSAARREGGNG